MNFASLNCKSLAYEQLADGHLMRNIRCLMTDVFILSRNDHYFNQDGECVACQRFTEYRRRSKRISKKRKQDQATANA